MLLAARALSERVEAQGPRVERHGSGHDGAAHDGAAKEAASKNGCEEIDAYEYFAIVSLSILRKRCVAVHTDFEAIVSLHYSSD